MPPITKIKMEKKIKELEEKQAELQKQIDELKQVKIEEPKKRWKPKLNEKYWFITAGGQLDWLYWLNNEFDNWRYLTGNVFKTEEEALEYKNKIEIQAKFKNFVEERSEELDWKNDNQKKYYLYCDCDKKRISINNMWISKTQGVIYASNRKILEDAIAEIGEDNIKKYVLEVEE